VYQPNDQILAAATNRRPAPVCQSEGYGNADLMDIATGLRAMVKGNLPQAKPAAPMVIGEVLPQSGPRDYVARRAKQLKGSRFVSLARCEEQAWAELQWAATSSQVYASGRALQGHIAESSIEQMVGGHESDPFSDPEEHPDAVGMFGVVDRTALDKLASDEEAAWRVESIMTALSDREWTAIQMKAEGLSDQEIAEALGASLPTAKKVVRQARAKAKTALV
jgi:DNA-directed RNA polymerase specialized sigma24 family protein